MYVAKEPSVLPYLDHRHQAGEDNTKLTYLLEQQITGRRDRQEV